MKRNIANLIMFQLGWFACVLGAAYNAEVLGSITVLALVIIHLTFTQHRSLEIGLLVLAGVVGFVWESLLATAGIISYSDQNLVGSAPLWMAVLWINFATTINHSLAWFKKHLLIASLGAMLSAPLAYYAGERLGALQLPQLWLALSVIGLGWAVLFPMLCKFADLYAISTDQSITEDKVKYHV